MSECSTANLINGQSNEEHATLKRLTDVSNRYDALTVGQQLMEINHWLQDDLKDLSQRLDKVVADPKADLAWSAAQYLLERPGKRVRPLCVLLAAQMGGRPFDEDIRRVAIAAELVHAATLLHDDVIDQGSERRGQPTARIIFGNAASVLGGDHLLLEALKRVQGLPTEIMTSLLDVISGMVSAEALQLEMRNRCEPNRERYLTVVHGKTAALFRWALESGARLGGLNATDAATLGDAGLKLGMTFQLVDDLLDLTGDPAQTGKDVSLDLMEGKLTWPIILAAERSEDVRHHLSKIGVDGYTPSAEDIKILVTLIRQTGAVEDTRTEANNHAIKAKIALSKLPESRSRQALETVVDAALERNR